MIHNHDEAGSLPAATTKVTLMMDTHYAFVVTRESVLKYCELPFNRSDLVNLPTELVERYENNIRECMEIHEELKKYWVGVRG